MADRLDGDLVGVDVERGYAVFGSTGALVFAAITGLAMLSMLRAHTRQLDARRSTGAA
jgi:hypothetical protein